MSRLEVDSVLTLLDASTALRAVAVMTGVAHFITGTQWLANRELFATGGMLDWRQVQRRHPVAQASLAVLPAAVAPGPVITGAAVLAKCCAAVAIVGFAWGGWPLSIPLAILVISNAVTSLHLSDGETAADRLGNLTALALLLAALAGTPLVTVCCLAFIAAQATLSYLTGGATKIRSQRWRNGSALQEVMATRAFGHPRLAGLLRGDRRIAVALSFAVILFELLFPLVLVLPANVALFVMAAGVVFHFSVAVTMGLNVFFWACLAAYPALLFFARQS